jgi:hypothetical protein
MTLAAQNTDSLPGEGVAAIFTNCATIVSFRVSASDAERLAKQFGGAILPSVLQEIPDYTMHVRTLKDPDEPKEERPQIGGAAPSGPHYVATHPPFQPHPDCAWRDRVMMVSHARYAKQRAVVQEQIQRLFFTSRPETVQNALYGEKRRVWKPYNEAHDTRWVSSVTSLGSVAK